jgi:alpha-amylase
MSRYLEMLRWQEAMLPSHHYKMRFIENHDSPRLIKSVDRNSTLAWTAFMAFLKGPLLINGGQESENSHTPSLFTIDKIVWKNYPLATFFASLASIRKSQYYGVGQFTIVQDEPVILAAWHTEQGTEETCLLAYF